MAIDGPQAEWSDYSIRGQQRLFERDGLAEKEGGWYRVPGKVDRASWYLLGFFFVTIAFLFGLEAALS